MEELEGQWGQTQSGRDEAAELISSILLSKQFLYINNTMVLLKRQVEEAAVGASLTVVASAERMGTCSQINIKSVFKD